MNVFYIPTSEPFLETLAQGALRLYGDAPEKLADLHILLPTRRAVRMMTDVFLDITNGAPLILPRLRAIADIDDAELELWVYATTGKMPEIHPAISAIERQAVLTQMLQKRDPALNYARASGMARALADLMDRIADEDLSLDAIDHLVPSEYAEHWQLTVEFLSILRTVWPAYLKDRGLMTATERRSLLLRTLATHWTNHSPNYPVWIAGVTGSLPAVSDLMRAVAGSSNGQVILSGFDPLIPESAKEDLQHPYYQTHQTLSRLSVSSHDVRLWPTCVIRKKNGIDTVRREFWDHVLCTNNESQRWTEIKHQPHAEKFMDVISDMRLISCENRSQEASVIALQARDILSDKDARLAIVTPDRTLAHDIIAACARYKIDVNDSAGEVLHKTEYARFLFLCLKVVMNRYHPVDLISLFLNQFFNHSLLSIDTINRIDRLMRGIRPPTNIEEFVSELIWRGKNTKNPAQNELSEKDQKDLLNTLSIFSDFEKATRTNCLSVLTLIRSHLMMAEKLCKSNDQGLSMIWTEDEGMTLSRFFSDLLLSSETLPNISFNDYADFLMDMMSGVRVNERGVGHPRLALLGVFESRLISCTHVILAGMNEGIWPQGPRVDPWLSRRMRQDFGLPLDDIQTGRMAHDFLELVQSPHVILTRSERTQGEITVPSRWWQRLEIVIQALGYNPQSLRARDLISFINDRDSAQKAQASLTRPKPSPPCALRPRRISATNIDLLIKNPYGFYARHILRLFPLDPYDMDVDGRVRGIILHNTLEKFISSSRGELSPQSAGQLLAILSDVLSAEIHDATIRSTLWPRLEKTLLNFLDQEKNWRTQGFSPLYLEQKWFIQLDIENVPYTITARFDRLDKHNNGTFALIDYKTGAKIPSKREAEDGHAAQIPVELWISRKGQSADEQDIVGTSVETALLWPISARKKDLSPWGQDDVDLLCQIASRDVPRIISAYHNDHTPYLPVPDSSYAPDFDDYVHLSRQSEWWGIDLDKGDMP